jgi:hypothetical protein
MRRGFHKAGIGQAIHRERLGGTECSAVPSGAHKKPGFAQNQGVSVR